MELFAIRHLAVGKDAADIEGPDQNGVRFKLSDYRGKVVLLYFWQHWNPSTPGYYVLDSRGVIRHKWVGAPGEKAIDTALQKLINEAEVNGKK